MKKSSFKMGLHNKYEFTLEREGVEIQKVYAENLVTNHLFKELNIIRGEDSLFGSLRLGSGDGVPSVADTNLFYQLWNITSSVLVSRSIDDDSNTTQVTRQYMIPATTNYVGTVTEVGMYSRSGLWSHAMIQDAEGNNISIQKTEFDILYVAFTIYLTINYTDNTFTPFRASKNRLNRAIYDLTTYSPAHPLLLPFLEVAYYYPYNARYYLFYKFKLLRVLDDIYLPILNLRYDTGTSSNNYRSTYWPGSTITSLKASENGVDIDCGYYILKNGEAAPHIAYSYSEKK